MIPVERPILNRQIRIVYAMISVAAVGVVFAIQRGVRPFVREHGYNDFGVLDWMPSFLTALAFPLAFAALDPHLRRFGWWCVWALLMQLLHEMEHVRQPQHRFDWHDVAAIAAGVSLAYLLVRRSASRASDDVDGLARRRRVRGKLTA